MQLAVQDSSLLFSALRGGPEPLQGNSYRVNGGNLLVGAADGTWRLDSGQSCADNFFVRLFYFGQRQRRLRSLVKLVCGLLCLICRLRVLIVGAPAQQIIAE